LINFH